MHNNFSFGDLFYAVVSDRDSEEELLGMPPNFRIERGFVTIITQDYIIDCDPRYLTDKSVKSNCKAYLAESCFTSLEQAEEYIMLYNEEHGHAEEPNELVKALD